tara:strand:+ start:377 stop:562 length:186 start_codon:yes stop_codon:yes gene_type:complete
MTTSIDLDDLKSVFEELERLKIKHPDAYKDFARFIKINRGVGYKNMCKIWIGETTPEKLKE